MHGVLDWLPLDNAAKIYPTASSKLSPAVFRISAKLRAPVRLLLLVAGTAVLAAFLLALDLLMPGRPWSPTLALPLTALAGAFAGLASAVERAWRARFFAMLAVVLASAGVFVAGLEALVNLYFAGAFRLSWSLVVCGCIVPLVGLLLYVQYRLKATRDDIRKIFHM
jgi:hypothetical protein